VIQLHNLGIGAGDDSTPLDIDEAGISTLAVDPVEASRTIVTMNTGNWYLVSESVGEIERLIQSGG
jgi:hypothetical protein